MFLTFLIFLGVIIALVLVMVAMQPAEYVVTRSANINAPPPDVFDRVNDFHNWEAWSPWAKLDPAAKNAFEGAASGTGAIFAWSGNKKVGEGRMTITDSRPYELVRTHLQFVRPFRSESDAEFTFKPVGDRTSVTWTMTGRKNFISKGFCMFMDMDKMVGGDFDRGLAQLKTVAEVATRK